MLFDNPTAGLSPKLAGEVLDKINRVRDEFGITVILVEQDVKRALKLGDFAGRRQGRLQRKAARITGTP